MVTAIAHVHAHQRTITPVLGMNAATADIAGLETMLRRLWLRVHRLLGIGEGFVVVLVRVFAVYRLVIAVGNDWNGAEELEPPLRRLEAAASILRFDRFVWLDSGDRMH